MRKKQTLEEVQKTWYAKLKESGFEDIERNEYTLFSSSDRFLDTRRIALKASNESYFHLANEFLNSHEFDNNRESIIWDYHCNGLTLREIATTLNKVKKNKIENKISVQKVILKIKNLMIKKYFPK